LRDHSVASDSQHYATLAWKRNESEVRSCCFAKTFVYINFPQKDFLSEKTFASDRKRQKQKNRTENYCEVVCDQVSRMESENREDIPS